MASYLDAARQQWEEGERRLSAEVTDPGSFEVLMDQVEAVTEELRRRIGERFTLDELAAVYGAADNWVLEAVAERGERPGWARKLSVAQDAAFHRYARGATDYSP